MSPLKFFRVYNKYILAVGVSLLMIAFLIQPTMSIFQPDLGDVVIGRIDGEKVTRLDEQAAGVELNIIASMLPLSDPAPDGAIQWLLMVHEARSMGLSASDWEVRQFLETLQLDPKRMVDAMRRQNPGLVEDHIRQAVRHWIMVQNYQELVLGSSHMPIHQRAEEHSRLMQFGFRLPPEFLDYFKENLMGAPRLSEPLIKRFVYDRSATAKISMLPIEAANFTEDAPEPSPEKLTELFNEYRDVLRGEGKPYGFGYKVPDRVKIEYMVIPFTRLRDKAKVAETDAYAYYSSHMEDYRVEKPKKPDEKDPISDALDLDKGDLDLETGLPGSEQPQYKPYTQVRDQIIRQLREQEATELGRRMVAAAKAYVARNEGALPRDGAFRDTSKLEPIPLDEIAEAMQKEFGVLPDAVRRGDDWLDRDDLLTITGLGSSVVHAGARPINSVDYILSARSIVGDEAAPVTNPPLQARLLSEPTVGIDGTRFLFRLIDAQKAHAPESLDAVREQVAADAKRLTAYQKLKDERQTWLLRAASAESLEELARELKTQVVAPPPFSRRREEFGGALRVPALEHVGQSEQFVDAVFNKVQDLPPQPEQFEQVDREQRLVAVPIDQNLTLYVALVEQFTPMTEDEYKLSADRLSLGPAVRRAMDPDERFEQAFSIDAIAKRVGFEWEGRGEEEEGDEQAGDGAEAAKASNGAE